MKGRTTLVMLLLIILTAGFVTAQPLGVEDVDVGTSSRFDDTTTPEAVDAQAGNVTELTLHGLSVTRFWQGFYGNITGTIILSDASGANFYDWNVTTPTGQVYASRNNAVSWTNINCSNATHIAAEETALGQNSNDPDSITNTFTNNNHPDFNVGLTTITGCPTTQAYNATGEQGNAFWQVLLNADTDTIYTTIIEDTTPEGFDGNPWHFQLLVGENGLVEGTTPYYFYLEIR
ncbi:hypothetical protein KO361_00245 [Candidatus Woesearchaeota archaeon]|jgi:hypothetical protein|nr:hypothetical protein [Candidatus Woesearchaeota archaeon]